VLPARICPGLVVGSGAQAGEAVKLTRPIGALKVPVTVQGVIDARIDRLPANEKELLQTLAVIGMEFPLALAREVVQKSPDQLNGMLNDLQLAELFCPS
jgi:predicted ATPase